MNSVTNSVLLLVVRVIYCPGPVASAVDGIQGPAHHGERSDNQEHGYNKDPRKSCLGNNPVNVGNANHMFD